MGEIIQTCISGTSNIEPHQAIVCMRSKIETLAEAAKESTQCLEALAQSCSKDENNPRIVNCDDGDYILNDASNTPRQLIKEIRNYRKDQKKKKSKGAVDKDGKSAEGLIYY